MLNMQNVYLETHYTLHMKHQICFLMCHRRNIIINADFKVHKMGAFILVKTMLMNAPAYTFLNGVLLALIRNNTPV